MIQTVLGPVPSERLGARAKLAEERTHHAFLLPEEGLEQVLGLDRLMAALDGE